MHARHDIQHTNGEGPEADAGAMSGKYVLCAAVAAGVREV